MPDIDFEKEVKKKKLQEELKEYERQKRKEEVKESMEDLVKSLVTGVSSLAKISASGLEAALDSLEKKDRSRKEGPSEAQMIKRRLELRKKQEELRKIKREKKKKKKEAILYPSLIATFLFVGVATGFEIEWLAFLLSFVFYKIVRFLVDRIEPREIFRGLPLFSTLLIFVGIMDGFSEGIREWLAFALALTAYYGSRAFMNREDLRLAGASRKKEIQEEGPKKDLGRVKAQKKLEENAEFLELMTISNGHLDIIYRCFEKAGDREIKEYSLKLYERGIEILKYIKENPDKLVAARRFLTYYLETAANICDKYMSLPVESLKSQDMEGLVENTKKAMILLETAFDKEYEKLLQDDILDVETDIKVLENSMKWDNYMD